MRRPFATLLVLLSFPILSNADALVSTLNYVRFYSATDPNVIYACQNTNGAACAGSVLAPGTNWTATYFSDSSTSFGKLSAFASVSLSGDNSLGGFPSFLSIGARAGYLDALHFAGVKNGTVYFKFHVTGQSGQTPGQSGRPQLQIVPYVNGQLDYAHQTAFLFDSNGDALVPMSLVNGGPLSFEVDFYALAQIFNWTSGASAFADYSHTLILDQISVTDENGTPVTDFSIQSDSGTYYGPNGVVPEPGSVLLLVTGLGILPLQRRCRRERS